MRFLQKGILIFAVCFALLCASAAAALLLVDSRELKLKVTSELSQRLSAQVGIGGIAIRLFDLPHLELRDCTLVFKNGSRIVIPRARIYPGLASLLTGEPVSGTVELDGPDLKIQLPAQNAPASPAPPPDVLQQQAARVLADTMSKLPAGRLSVANGTASFSLPGRPSVLTVHAVSAELVAAPQALAISIGGESRLWSLLKVQAQCTRTTDADSEFPVRCRIGADLGNIDIETIRQTASELSGNAAMINALTGNVRSGKISRFSGRLELPATPEAIKSGALSCEADLEEFSLKLPGAYRDMTGLSGHIQIGGGRIEATRLQGRMGGSRIDNATVRFDLLRGSAPDLISAGVTLDLSALPDLLRLLPPGSLAEELCRIEAPRGQARGAFSLAWENGAYGLDIRIDGLELDAQYRGFPMPIAVEAGSCHFRAPLLALSHLRGTVGSAVLPDISAQFSLTPDAWFSIEAQGASLDIRELRGILNSFSPTRDFLEKLQRAEGKLRVDRLSMEGPIKAPRLWAYSATGQAQDISAAYAGLEGSIECRAAALSVTQSSLSLSGARAAFLDSRLEGSITIHDYLDGISKIELSGAGSLGRGLMDTLYSGLELPVLLKLRSPAVFPQLQLSWNRGKSTSFSGDFVFEKTVRAGITLHAVQHGFFINRLTLRDPVSSCSARLGLHRNSLAVGFAGELHKQTLDRVLADNRFMQGWARGDFTADLNLAAPLASTASGSMEWENIGFPGSEQLPVTIDKGSVSAGGSRIEVRSATVSTADSSADLSGKIDFSELGFLFDLDVISGRINADPLLEAFRGERQPTEHAAQSGAWQLPFSGTARVSAGELMIAGYTLSPCTFEAGLSDGQLGITAGDVRLCGIPVSGGIKITPGAVSFEARPALRDGDVEAVLKCFTRDKSMLTGSCDVKGDLRGSGRPEEIADSAGGTFSFKAKDGRIYRSNLLTKILSFLSIRQLLTGGILTVTEKGYAYESLKVHCTVEGPTVQVREAVLVSSSLNLVCKGTVNWRTKQVELDALATPFQFVDYALSKIPIAGRALKKTIIGVPLHIGGAMDNPKISPRTPTTIGKDIVKAATDIIKLPIKLIEPSREPEPKQEPKQ